MYHINDRNESKPCRAASPAACRFYSEEDPRHYENANEAEQAATSRLVDQFGTLPARSVRYSFLKEFKEAESRFNESFQGFPTRFFNTDLRGKAIQDYVVADPSPKQMYRGNMINVISRLANAVSSPSDLTTSEADLKAAAEELGFRDFQPIDDAATLRTLSMADAYYATTPDGDQVLITPEKQNSKNFNSYTLRYGLADRPPLVPRKSFHTIDSRTLMGLYRIQRKTGQPVGELIYTNPVRDRENGESIEDFQERSYDIKAEKNRLAVDALLALEDAQDEGSNFRAQQKYVKETSSTVATAFDDKKNPDELHKKMMKNTPLNKFFRKVEIDNDVDAAEFEDFERAYAEVRASMPTIPAGREPELRIRKLGKHRATGLFAPHKNAVAIDVRDSSSFVHEMSHHWDIAVMGNASLSPEFRDVVRGYSKGLRVPPGLSKKADYYTTPTEVFARGMEVYLNERKGINNRLVNPTSFADFDYQPIQSNPELKKKMFDYFDSIYA